MTFDTAWPAPVRVAEPVRPPPRAPRVWRAALAITLAGVGAAAIGWGHPGSSLGMALVMAVIGLATMRASIMSSPARRVTSVAIAAFLPWFAIRSSPWLLIPDLIAAAALMGLGLSMRNGAGAGDSVGGYLARVRQLGRGAIETPHHVHLGVRTTVSASWRQSVRQMIGPALIGLTVAASAAVVLASGDALFASYLDLEGVLGSIGTRFLAASVVMAVVAMSTGAAIASESRPSVPSTSRWSARSAIIAVVPLCVVYVVYVIVQCSSLVLGAAYVRDRTGLTFAEYARSGFFQLVAVALMTFIGLIALRPTVRLATAGARTVLLMLAATATACTVVMVVAAVVKLDLYADVFGLTMLRVYTSVFAAWLGVALLIAFGSHFRPNREWVIPAVAVTALVGVFAMNVANPERIVADHNLTHTISSDEFDLGYLIALSDDARRSIVEHLDDLRPGDRELALAVLCEAPSRSTSGLDWNWSAAAARSATREVC